MLSLPPSSPPPQKKKKRMTMMMKKKVDRIGARVMMNHVLAPTSKPIILCARDLVCVLFVDGKQAFPTMMY